MRLLQVRKREGGEQQMLYRILLRLIERGLTDGLEEKIDIFYAAGKLTDAEYADLINKLHSGE